MFLDTRQNIYGKNYRTLRFFITACIAALIFFNPVFTFSQTGQSRAAAWSLITGTSGGLTGVDRSGRAQNLWSGGAVKKILSVKTKDGLRWFILSDEGIMASDDLYNWEHRDQGLPKRAIKYYEDGTTFFSSVFQDIKDLEADPQNPENMVCAIKDSVYLTRDGGQSWESLGMPNYRSNGIKAVAVTTLDNELTVFCSHNIYGIYIYKPGKSGAKWEELDAGLENLETTGNPDEISDIAVWLPQDNSGPVILVSQTFRQRIYRLNISARKFELIWSGEPGFGTVDSLLPVKDSLFFIENGEVMELALPAAGTSAAGASAAAGTSTAAGTSAAKKRSDITSFIKNDAVKLKLNPLCAAIPGSDFDTGYGSLSELWLIQDKQETKNNASNREGLYLPVNHALDPYSLAPYMETIKKQNLNMVVIDMKDDYGRLRFTPEDQTYTKWGRVFRPVDLESFLKTMKDAGVYTVARIVVFKDPEAAVKENGKYAVWDSVNKKPWEGYYDTRQKKDTPKDSSVTNKTEILPDKDPDWEILRTYYDERWIDPYAEEYWDYIAVISQELCRRGFDEIQYDYIRFPTDGINLGDASYRWRSTGMDMDSAIISFLTHVRQKVKSPISVDIYGANGWYRTGARTGQEVEMLAPLVDVICPMYYPSHFEQDFLAQNPPEERPYRIYYEGVRRTYMISRGQVVVRPWAQAFYLNVSYDRKYYNSDYIARQIKGVHDAGNGGFTYWNNSGRYDDIPPPAN
ncbi:MAG: hypothetical protein FWD78_10880 [Treponema sp.]|nr:hypothetical protein [Treponema sp.]